MEAFAISPHNFHYQTVTSLLTLHFLIFAVSTVQNYKQGVCTWPYMNQLTLENKVYSYRGVDLTLNMVPFLFIEACCIIKHVCAEHICSVLCADNEHIACISDLSIMLEHICVDV